MNLSERLELIAEHIGDDQPNLPAGAKNDLLLAAKLATNVLKIPQDDWSGDCLCCGVFMFATSPRFEHRPDCIFHIAGERR